MATNADPAVDDSTPTTEDDIRRLKYGDDDVESIQKVEDEIAETTEEEDGAEESSEPEVKPEEPAAESQEESAFVKQFPNIKGDTPEEYAKNLEIAYQNSTKEALRLKELSEASRQSSSEEEDAPVDPVSLWVKQQLDEEITTAYTSFSKDFPQVTDADNYGAFTKTVGLVQQTIMSAEGRMAKPAELYKKAAIILGWEPVTTPTSEEKLGMALKDSAAVSNASSKASSASGAVPKSKVTDKMVDTYKKMYPGKSDADIRKELEPYVN